jgi:anthranilate phosphoribosyltransferase
MSILPHLHRIVSGADLSLEEAREAMWALLSGEVDTALVASFLTALRMKGESSSEITGFAGALRDAGVPVLLRPDGPPAVDTCGTGGDGAQTFNISTVAAFVVAGAGIRVAKHGNRAISSRCGSADVLEKLGISMLSSADEASEAIDQVGIGFLFAPAFHPAIRHVMPARLQLKMRTVFNLLGPLANPAKVKYQVIGVPGLREAEIVAPALHELGVERGFVVHGDGGLDEVSTTGPTEVFEIANGSVKPWVFQPEDLGLPLTRPGDLVGGDAEENAAILLSILEGAEGPRRDIVLVNAAFAILAAGAAESLADAYRLAVESVDSGRALARLEALRSFRPADESAA